MTRSKINATALFTVAIFTFTSVTRGQSTQSSSNVVSSASASGSVAISPLKKGQSAPFSGILFTPRAAASIVAEVNTARERTQIEVAAAVSSAEARKNYAYNEAASRCETDKSVIRISAEAEKKRVVLLEDEVKKLREETPSRGTWLSLGVVGGFLLSSIAIFATTRLTK